MTFTKDEKLVRRIVLATLGMVLTGLSIGFFKESGFGVDPYQCFANGLANVIPIRFGTLYMLVNIIQLVIVFFLDRHYIGYSTFVNLFLLGYMVEGAQALIAALFPAPTLLLRIVFLIVGVVITCLAAAMYYTADMGVSTYDAIPLHIADCKPHIAGHVLPFRAVRIIADLICTLIGVLLGVKAGIGTVITALFMGPLITFFRVRLTDPWLAK